MRTVAASKFKASCLKLMDEVRTRREPLLITKRGVPVAKLVPAGDTPMKVFGGGASTARILGDITAPVLPPEAWRGSR